jgi:hypothetical protein
VRPLQNESDWWLYGYRVDEVELPPLNWQKPTDGSEFSSSMKGCNMFRRNIQAAAIPNPIIGYVAPRPDTGDQMSLKQGAKKRLVHDRPKMKSRPKRLLRRHVARMIRKLFHPLQGSDVLTFEEWLEQSNYPEWRKKQLRECMSALEQGKVQEHKIWEAKMFAKDEFYLEYKYHRTINARSDYIKCIIGRFAASIEHQVFKHPAFIKKVPRSEWPEYITGRCSGRQHGYASDYSSFEASFVEEVMKCCEMQLYTYMLKNVWTQEVNQRFKMLAGWNNITAKAFFVKLLARRLSGEMVTSLGNGFSNLMVNTFVLKQKGCRNVSCVVEGDDGLFMFDGPMPTPKDFEDLGFVIKLTPVQTLSDASFCGVVFDPEDRAALADPYKTLATCSWVEAKYGESSKKNRQLLAHVKGLSLLAQYPGCPVLQSVALWMLRVNGFQPSQRDAVLSYAYANSRDWWQREVLRQVRKSPFVPKRVGQGSRSVIERVYGMSVSKQVELEALFDSATGSVDLSTVDGLPELYKQHWRRYTVKRHANAFDKMYPFHIRPDREIEGEDRWRHHVPALGGYVRD